MIPTLAWMVTHQKEFSQALTLLDRLGPAAEGIAPQLSTAMNKEESIVWRVYQALAPLEDHPIEPGEALPIIAEVVVRSSEGLLAVCSAINIMLAPMPDAAAIWPLLDEHLRQGDAALHGTIAYIGEQLLGRAEAARRMSERLGAERVIQIFSELDAQAASD